MIVIKYVCFSTNNTVYWYTSESEVGPALAELKYKVDLLFVLHWQYVLFIILPISVMGYIVLEKLLTLAACTNIDLMVVTVHNVYYSIILLTDRFTLAVQ